MTESSSVTVRVELDIDNEVWQMNYGLMDPTPENIRKDIAESMRDVIHQMVERYIDATGNEGLVHVTVR